MLYDLEGVVVDETMERARMFANVLHPEIQFKKFNHSKSVSQASASYDKLKFKACFISEEFSLNEIAKIFGMAERRKRAIFFIYIAESMNEDVALAIQAGFDSVLNRAPSEAEKEKLVEQLQAFLKSPKPRSRVASIEDVMKSLAQESQATEPGNSSESALPTERRRIVFDPQSFLADQQRVDAATDRLRQKMLARGIDLGDDFSAPVTESVASDQDNEEEKLEVPVLSEAGLASLGMSKQEFDELPDDEKIQLAAFASESESSEPEKAPELDDSALESIGMSREEYEELPEDEKIQLAAFATQG